jgi:hypothetical protein
VRRRTFIAGLGSAAAWPVVVGAQQQAMPVIGFLSAQSAELDFKDVTVPVLQGLKETGYVEGQNLTGMSRFLLNIEKRSLSWLTLCGVGLASKNAM